MATIQHKSADKTVANIAARNAISPRRPHMTVLVLDAIGDTFAGPGKALYRWVEESQSWYLVTKDNVDSFTLADESKTISLDQVQASYIPASGVIWDAYVQDDNNIIYQVQYSVSGSTITIIPDTLGQFDGKTFRFKYAYGSLSQQIAVAVEGKANVVHQHQIADVADLQEALDAAAASGGSAEVSVSYAAGYSPSALNERELFANPTDGKLWIGDYHNLPVLLTGGGGASGGSSSIIETNLSFGGYVSIDHAGNSWPIHSVLEAVHGLRLNPALTGANAAATASSIWNSNYAAWKGFQAAEPPVGDNAWESQNGANQWIAWDFGAPVIISGVKFGGYSGANTMPHTVRVQASNDGSSWTDVMPDTANPTTSSMRTFSFPPSEFRHWRLYFPVASGRGDTIVGAIGWIDANSSKHQVALPSDYKIERLNASQSRVTKLSSGSAAVVIVTK